MESRQNLITELRRTAEIFDKHNHDNTSSWIRFIANNLEKGLPSDYQKDFIDVLDAFKFDICKTSFSRKIHDEIGLILATAINTQRESRFSKILLRSYPLIHNWRIMRENVSYINEIFLEKYKSGAIEKCFYVFSFIYLLEVEGGFDDIIRVLYILALASKNKPIRYEKIFNTPLKKIREQLVKLGFSDILFAGWDDGHLRNAIAHARFSFDTKTKKMNFVDIHPWYNKKVYDKSFTLNELLEKAKMITDVSHIFSDYIVLLRIFDLIKHKWIKRRE